MDYYKKTVAELKAICKLRNIKGISKKNKRALVELIEQHVIKVESLVKVEPLVKVEMASAQYKTLTPPGGPEFCTSSGGQVSTKSVLDASNEIVSPKTSPDLSKVFDYMKKELKPEMLTELASKLNAIRAEFTGDGAGLSGGILTDKFVTKFLSTNITGFEEHHTGESDCKIIEQPVSLKKINGKSTIALDWSKNGEDSKKRERFCNDMMIINLKTEQWWKTSPATATPDEVTSKFFSKQVKAGIYFVSSTYCKGNVDLKSNNKTNSLIESIPLYKMLMQSMADSMVIEFPTEFPVSTFNILRAFD